MTDAELATLAYFRRAEFRHPALVDFGAAKFLDAVRAIYAAPLVLTSDARTLEENAAASGSSPTSWHLSGRAFDLRYPGSAELVWRFVAAVVKVAGERPIELELVNSAQDRHLHLAVLPPGRQSRIVVRAD